MSFKSLASPTRITPIFVNQRAYCLKVLVHDGVDVVLAARRLSIGKLVWAMRGYRSHGR